MARVVCHQTHVRRENYLRGMVPDSFLLLLNSKLAVRMVGILFATVPTGSISSGALNRDPERILYVACSIRISSVAT
jgi:hypothetical protein